ncbi:MAG: DUF4372 domain-containing protein [Elusimicrobia bacterium]|nr:DUF4372 domain-containing protein [Elusimicrobiota bacterium]
MSSHHTLLGQMLQMFPRLEFQKFVFETRTEYYARGFSSCNHFSAMLFGQYSAPHFFFNNSIKGRNAVSISL